MPIKEFLLLSTQTVLAARILAGCGDTDTEQTALT
jgi:hypothetical protein